ncbi:MAG: ABC transporter permease [bacterium]|nr:ABC transporter permease [bacterium]MXV90234.1 ABC transporter permease [Acidimicrobiia bacterium]MYC46115.1 ABC transporter permease [Acidimicrobiia bacterium]MYI19269.1 ABC transporter permease [Acidimicrobiia bacterium]
MIGTVTVDARISDWVVQRVVRRVMGPLVPLTATVAALLVGAAMVWGFGGDPVEGYRAMFTGAFGGISEFADTTVKATPLLLVGVGICIAFRASVINIGGEGQIIAGALLSTVVVLALPDLHRGALLPLALIAGAVGGACMGFIPGVLKAYANVNEILSTIMLNIVAGYMMQYLLLGPMIDKEAVEAGNHIAQTKRLSPNSDLPILLGDTQMNLGIVIGAVVAIGAFFLLWRTSLGYEIRAVGGSKDASRYAGMKVERRIVQALTLSGMMSGLGGAVLVFSSVAHRLSVESGPAGFTQLAGFNGIVAALFGGLHPLWTIPAAILFGGLLVGANALQRAVQVATPLVVALSGLVVVFVVSSDRAVRWARHLGERFDIGASPEHDRTGSAASGGADAPTTPSGEGAEP